MENLFLLSSLLTLLLLEVILILVLHFATTVNP